jgi:ribosomal protein S21
MASAICPVSSVVSVAPRCSVESSSSSSSGGVCGSNSITSSSFGSSSVKLPLVAQQQAFPGSSMPISVEMTVADPSLQYANMMWFRGSYNAQVFVGEDEPADSVVRRFRKAVMMAGVIPECRRRRFFETPQDIVKRKQQNARRKKPRFSSIITTSLLLSCSCPGLAYPVVESSSYCGRLLEHFHDASSVVELSSCNVESSHKLLERKQRERILWKRFVRVYFEAKFLGLCPISSTSSLCGLLRYVSFLKRDLENLPCYSILVHRTQLLTEFFCAGMSHGKHLRVFVI